MAASPSNGRAGGSMLKPPSPGAIGGELVNPAASGAIGGAPVSLAMSPVRRVPCGGGPSRTQRGAYS